MNALATTGPSGPVASASSSQHADASQVVYVAGFWRRFAAAGIDGAIVLPIAYLMSRLGGRLAGVQLPDARHGGVDYWVDLALAGDPALWGRLGLGVAIVALYLLAFQALAGKTIGMHVVRLRITDVHGEPPRVLRAAVRTIGYAAGVATLGLGFAWIGVDREKRGLHDWIAGTYVIKLTRGPAAPRS